MSIEKNIEVIAVAITKLVDHMIEQESPPGDPAVEPEPVDVPDLTPETVPVAGIEVEEVPPEVVTAAPPPAPAPTLAPVPGPAVTKAKLWEEIQAVYAVLHTVNRGEEIGGLLAKYKATHLDQLDPKHYVAVHDGLMALRNSVQEAGNG